MNSLIAETPKLRGPALATSPGLGVGWTWPLILSILTGLALWASFFAPLLVWIGLVPVSLLIKLDADRRLIYGGAWLGGYIFFLLGTYWISYCAPWVWIGWLVLAAYLALYFPAFVIISRVAHRRWNVPLILTIPLAWVALEFVRMHLLSGFGWLMLAHSVWEWERTIQIADLAGVYGVSFVIATFNAICVEFLTLPLFVRDKNEEMQFNPRLFWSMGFAIFVVCLNVGYGQFRLDNASFEKGPRIVVLQTNIPQEVRNFDAAEVDDQVWGLARSVADVPADLVVFPETSYAYTYGALEPGMTNMEIAERYAQRISAPGMPLRETPTDKLGDDVRAAIVDGDKDLDRIARALGKPILMGTVFWDVRLSGARQTNASVLVVPGEGRKGYYEKVHILPFGEYVPLGGNIPFIRAFIPYPADFNYDSDAGLEVRSVHSGNLNLAPLICFEDTIPDLARAYMRQATPEEPVEILVNQSNDGWFRNSIEGSYHLAASVFRSVETRRPMVRSSNTGTSNLIDGNGKVIETFKREGLTQGVEGHMVVDVPLDRRSAPYVVLGDWLAWLSLGFVAVILSMSAIRQGRRIVAIWNRRWAATAT